MVIPFICTSTNTVKSSVSYLDQVIVGNLLGDAWMDRSPRALNTRLRYEQASPKHDDRFFLVYKYYVFLCSSNARVRDRYDKRSDRQYFMNFFSTRSLPYLTEFYNMFYILTDTGRYRKIVPANIELYITFVVLSFWIMDDGHWNWGLVLNTQGFTVPDVVRLSDAINTSLNLKSYMRMEAGAPVIYITLADVKKITPQLVQHMHPSTYYKLGL